jgi:hypothetical protein
MMGSPSVVPPASLAAFICMGVCMAVCMGLDVLAELKLPAPVNPILVIKVF